MTAPRPKALPVLRENFPRELLGLPQWVCWGYRYVKVKWTKVPFRPDGGHADSTELSTWTDIDSVWQAYQGRPDQFDGVGFVFSAADPFAGTDLDGCIDSAGAIAPEAMAIIRRLDSYTEVSPSGTGAKIWVRAALVDGGRHSTAKVKGFKKFEVYDRARYFVMTGHLVTGLPATIQERQVELVALHADVFGTRPRALRREQQREQPQAPSGCGLAGSDDELIRLAAKARNGAKFSDLWGGKHEGYGSRSEADLALCSIIAFYTGPDPARIESIVRGSALRREKWDRDDYLPRTIAQALKGKKEFYTGAAAAKATVPSPRDPADHRLILDPQDPLPSAREFLARHHAHELGRTLHHHRGDFMVWDGTRYAEHPNDQIRSRLYEFLETAWRPGGASLVVPFQPTRAKVDNVADALRAACHLDHTLSAPVWLGAAAKAPPASSLVAATNGLIDLSTERLFPHSPLFFSPHCLPFDFDPRAPSPAHWLRFLGQLWEDDPESMETLQEWFGYSLTPDTRQQKILLIIGPPRSGKGTIARVWTGALGPWAVAAPTLASLEMNFGLWPLIGKSLAIISDARLSGRADQAKIVERLLSISGEDTQTIDRKHREPWTGRLGARIVILTNELPRLADSSGAMASRFIVLRLTRSFLGEEDLGLEARLIGELPGILRWGIEGRQRLLARGYFAQPQSAAQAIQDLRDLSSPIGAFVAECCEVGAPHQQAISELFTAWCRWCEAQGRDHTGSVQMFGRDLTAALAEIRETRLSINGRRVRCYQGIRLVARRPQWSADQPIARGGGETLV